MVLKLALLKQNANYDTYPFKFSQHTHMHKRNLYEKNVIRCLFDLSPVSCAEKIR